MVDGYSLKHVDDDAFATMRELVKRDSLHNFGLQVIGRSALSELNYWRSRLHTRSLDQANSACYQFDGK